MEFVRARSDAQKDLRVKQIKDVAIKQYEAYGYDKISMKSIASELDFSRSNLYKYYTSKELIFTDILYDDFLLCTEELCNRLDREEKMSHKDLCDFIAEVTARHIRMIGLITFLPPILNKSVEIKDLLIYKDRITAKMEYFLSLLQKHIPELSLREIYLFGEYQFRFSMTSYHTMIKSPIEDYITDVEMLCQVNFDFESSYREYIYVILKGLIASRDVSGS
ncbi:MAG: TetR/AcrR family transcriptional regulator [Clostridium sp.]